MSRLVTRIPEAVRNEAMKLPFLNGRELIQDHLHEERIRKEAEIAKDRRARLRQWLNGFNNLRIPEAVLADTLNDAARLSTIENGKRSIESRLRREKIIRQRRRLVNTNSRKN